MSQEFLESELVTKTKGQGKLDLPLDFTADLPKEPYAWLKQYGLTLEELKQNHIGWSSREEMLIFPYFGETTEILMWQGRYFPKKNPKTFTRGYPEQNLIFPYCVLNSQRIVVVEDPVSAIKVSRHLRATPLFGANLSRSKAIRLSKITNHLTLWLDHDKIDAMVRFVEMYRSLFECIDFCITEKDPKEISDDEIRRQLCL